MCPIDIVLIKTKVELVTYHIHEYVDRMVLNLTNTGAITLVLNYFALPPIIKYV